MKLIAQRRLRYPLIGGKIYNPDDTFDAPKGDAKLLVAVKKARYAVRDTGDLPPPPPDVASAIGPIKAAQRAEEEREKLRAEAEALGVDTDGRWGVARLEEEIAKVKERPVPEAKDDEGAVSALKTEDDSETA